MDFLFEIKSFYFSILQIHTCYFSDKRTYKKRMLEGRMVTRKNSYIKYVFASIHPLRDTPHGNHRLLSYSFSIAFRGAILPALRPPTQKSFSPGARWGIALTPRAMPLFTIGRNTISKRLNDVSMGPSLDNERFNGAGKQTLRRNIYPPLLHQYHCWCRHAPMRIHFSPKFVRPWRTWLFPTCNHVPELMVFFST